MSPSIQGAAFTGGGPYAPSDRARAGGHPCRRCASSDVTIAVALVHGARPYCVPGGRDGCSFTSCSTSRLRMMCPLDLDEHPTRAVRDHVIRSPWSFSSCAVVLFLAADRWRGHCSRTGPCQPRLEAFEALNPLAGGVVRLVEPVAEKGDEVGHLSAASRKVLTHTLLRHSERTTTCCSWCQVARSERPSPRTSGRTVRVRVVRSRAMSHCDPGPQDPPDPFLPFPLAAVADVHG